MDVSTSQVMTVAVIVLTIAVLVLYRLWLEVRFAWADEQPPRRSERRGGPFG
jgi:hypothetical protein